MGSSRVDGRKVAYIVHDLEDAAVARRVETFRQAGADVKLAGFVRHADAIVPDGAWRLGRTGDGKFAQRAFTATRTALFQRAGTAWLQDVDVVVARTLEGLAIASHWRARLPQDDRPRLVYELLDIHRLMIGDRPHARLLRALERRLLRAADRVVISSPAYLTQYLGPYGIVAEDRVVLCENKLAAALAENVAIGAQPQNDIRRIGLFGIIRCRRSLLILVDAAKRAKGKLQIVLWGRPAYSAIPDFDALIENAEHVHFHGAYRSPHDLAEIYKTIDFMWTIDFYEEGGNALWQLPNRLYEAGLFAVPHLYRPGTAVATWLEARGLGIEIAPVTDERLVETLLSRDMTTLTSQRARYAAVPKEVWCEKAGTTAEAFLSPRSPAT